MGNVVMENLVSVDMFFHGTVGIYRDARLTREIEKKKKKQKTLRRNAL